MESAKELRARGYELRAEFRKLTERDSLTEQDEIRADEIARELKRIDRQLGIREEADYQRSMDSPASEPRAGAADYDPEGETRTAAPSGPVHVRSAADIVDPGIGQGAIADNDEFWRAVTSKQYDPRLEAYEARASKLYDLPNAGFLVPESSTTGIFDKAIESTVFWPKVKTYPVKNARSIVIPAFNDSDHSSTLYGGLTSYWEGEAEEITESNATFREMRLDLKGLKTFTTFSNELKESAGGFASLIEGKLGEALSWKIDTAILRGDGAGKPLGILESDCLITVPKESEQADETIVWENVKAMYARMLPASRTKAVWYVNNDAIEQLLGLYQSAGTAGIPVPVMNESNGSFSILGRPVVFTEKCSALGDVGDIVFADFSYYALAMLGVIDVAQSEHAFFTYDKHTVRAVAYLNGAPLLSGTFQPYKGSNTMSAFVTLAAR